MTNHDIILDGRGYMLAPGTYRRGLDAAGGVGGPPVRQVQREWAGGAGRAIQGERDRFWQSRGLLPAGRGDGPGPGPRETTLAIAGLAPLKRRHGVIAGGGPTSPPAAPSGDRSASWRARIPTTSPG